MPVLKKMHASAWPCAVLAGFLAASGQQASTTAKEPPQEPSPGRPALPDTTPEADRGQKVKRKTTRTGTIRVHDRFRSRHLQNERTLVVYLPPCYDQDLESRYPVLYMQDGQNLFDQATAAFGTEWQADETAERLIRSGTIEPLIIVGIYNTPARTDEYTPAAGTEPTGGSADRYGRFLVEEVKPFVDAHYRTRPDSPHTAVAGSSLGGLVSLHIASRYPERFSMCGAISPSVWQRRGAVLEDLAERLEAMPTVRFWVQMGGREGSTVAAQERNLAGARKLVALLDRAGRQRGRDYQYLELATTRHNEAAWAEHFGQMLQFFFPAGAQAPEAAPGGTRSVPDWAADAIFYQVFPERFRNGDPANDPTRASLEAPERVGGAWSVSRWTSQWYARAPWEQALGADFYEHGVFDRRYGGDLQGVLDELDYLEDLGINAIYLNPVFYARSLHKYDGNSYHHVDPFFGPDPAGDLARIGRETSAPGTWSWTRADRLFLRLVDQAHQRGIRVILDGVFNHTGRDFFAFADLRARQQRSPYRTWYNVVQFDDPATPENEFQYEGWWGVDTLPELADSPDGTDLAAGPKAYIFAATARWMDPDGDGDPSDGVDGWRLDVANEVPKQFWLDWNAHLRRLNPQVYTVTEIWDSAGQFLPARGFSASMNYYGFAFPVKGFLVDAAIPASEFLATLASRRAEHSQAVQYALQNLVDSHDTDRLASMIVNSGRHPYRSAARFDYDLAGRVSPRQFDAYDVRKPNARERRIQRLVALFQMTYVGSPLIYYGTEAGMWGADDPDNRMPMVWPDLVYERQTSDPLGRRRPVDEVKFDNALFTYYRSAVRLRRRHAALRRGTFRVLRAADAKGSFAFARTSPAETLVVAINRSDAAQELALPGTEDPALTGKTLKALLVSAGDLRSIKVQRSGQEIRVALPALTGAVLVPVEPGF